MTPRKKRPARKPARKAAAKKRSVRPGFRVGEAALRKYALGFPEAYEEFPWGERVIKVRKRIFVFMRGSADGLQVTTKLPHSYGAALLAPFAESTGYNLGKSGWVTASFEVGDHPPYDILRSWIEESYRAIAPKKFSAKLDE
ncbi:MAG TPA: MmcQ/YjbR family DNA-binding protein [Gammaproteobacteria bacterium]